MRWLFLFVLSLNLAYVAWELSLSSATTLSTVQPIKGVPAIVLLAELPQPGKSSPEHQGISIAADEESPRESVAAVLSPGISSAKSSADDKSKITAGSEPDAEIIKTPVKTETIKPDLTASTVLDQSGADRPKTDQSQAALIAAGGCYTLGPFRDLDELRILTRELKAYVVSADFRGREEKEQSLYWVNIKPAANREAALATGERLKQKKIRDYYVIREGENINGISLGYYRNKEGAEGLTRKVKKLGFDVVLEPVFKTYTVYWLDYQLAPGAKVPESIFNKYIDAAKKDKITRVLRECS
jgi:hypothetical protein